MRHLLVAWLALSACYAQVVQVANPSPNAFTGWTRTTTDWPGPAVSATGDSLAVRGREIAPGLWSLDVRTPVPAGGVVKVDLSTPGKWTRPALSADVVGVLGWPALAGTPLQMRGITPDGAGYLVHFAGRIGGLAHADLWLVHYPDAPAWASGELVLCASNPSIPDLTWSAPRDLRLSFGDAAVTVPGLERPTLLAAGEVLADGQARSWPVHVLWPRLLRDTDWAAAGASRSVVAVGVRDIWPLGGRPRAPAPMDSWRARYLPLEYAHLHSWTAGLGVRPLSVTTGAQEDQLFPGGEFAWATNLTPRYLAALGQSRRPCHHLESDGRLLRLADHPRLIFWEARPHPRAEVSPDRLGKVGSINTALTHGWWGPDEEHLLYNSVAVAYRATGSQALQWQLRHAAVHFLKQPGNKRVPRARAIGYRCLIAPLLWRSLEDRVLAQQVRDEWVRWMNSDIVPALRTRGGVWDSFTDPRLGPGVRWMPWQAAVGAWGMYVASVEFAHPEGKELAQAAAKVVIEQGYAQRDGDTWIAYYTVSKDGGEPTIGASDWTDFGMPLVLAVAQRENWSSERIAQLWAMQQARGSGKWLDPVLNPR